MNKKPLFMIIFCLLTLSYINNDTNFHSKQNQTITLPSQLTQLNVLMESIDITQVDQDSLAVFLTHLKTKLSPEKYAEFEKVVLSIRDKNITMNSTISPIQRVSQDDSAHSKQLPRLLHLT